MPTKLFFNFDIFGQVLCLVYIFGVQKCMCFKQWTGAGAISFHVHIPLSYHQNYGQKIANHAVITPKSAQPQTPSQVWEHCTLISTILLHTDILHMFLWFVKANAE
jgi:hypothetical protein